MANKTNCLQCLLFVFLSLLITKPAIAERYVALVIGNADYEVKPLRNSLNDARDVAQALRGLRFEVIEVLNADKGRMLAMVNDFGVHLQQATVGLFYYSGHGVQHHGNNYLMPINATIQTPTDLEIEGIDVRRVLGHMEQGTTQLNIVILDACRDNPFANLVGFRSYGERGLARLPGVRSSLIAYATQPDNTASDGTGRNGTYTEHLLRYLKQPCLSLPDLFSEVGRAVLQDTNGKQEPWVSFSPLPRFYLAGCAQPAPLASSPLATESPAVALQVSAERQPTPTPPAPALSTSKARIQQLEIPPKRGSYVWDRALMLSYSGEKIVIFEAQGKNDIHVAFSQAPNDKAPLYELVIGGWGNSQTVIRKGSQNPHNGLVRVQARQNPNAVMSKGWDTYWMSVNNGCIKVGKGNISEQNVFLEWTDPDPIKDLVWVGFSTWDVPISYKNIRVLTR